MRYTWFTMSLRRVLCLLVFVDVWISLALVTGGCRREPEASPQQQQQTRPQVQVQAEQPQAPAAAAIPAAAAVAPAEQEHHCGDGKRCGGGCNQWDKAADQVARRDVPNDARWQRLTVEGMHCGGCERRIIANVGALEGVLGVEADSQLGEVRVAMAPGDEARLTAAARARIEELGYRVVKR